LKKYQKKIIFIIIILIIFVVNLMSSVKKGSSGIKKIYMGTKQVLKVYKSTNLIYTLSSGVLYYQNGTAGSYSYTIPTSGTYKLEVWGAEGGAGSSNSPGKGGYSVGKIYLTAETILYVYIGGKGQPVTQYLSSGGGFNGGGNCSAWNGGVNVTGGGGGGTDIRIGSISLYARVIVAGGGGGATNNTLCNGGYGGGTSGGAPSGSYTCLGATQTSGGTGGCSVGVFGTGGSSTNVSANGWTGGGGGGWYGGAAGKIHGGGSGGSGWVFTQENYNAGYTSSSYTGGTWLLGNEYYMTETQVIAGNATMPTQDGSTTMIGNSGAGFAKITYVG
jgi:hypothetical protein